MPIESGFCIQQSERKAGINFLLVRWRLYLKLYFCKTIYNSFIRNYVFVAENDKIRT